MESVRKTNKEGRKKSQVVIRSGISNGNGIAGLLVFGGALVVAGFIALSSFATNRNKTKAKGKSVPAEPEPKPDNINRQDHDDHHVHETENTPNNDGDVVSASHVTTAMGITQTLILEEKAADSPNCFDDHQEIVLSDDSLPESGVSSYSNENGIEEECLASMFHNSGSQGREDESLKSIQTETNDDDEADLEGGKEEEKKVEVEEEEKEEVAEEESSKSAAVTALNSKEEGVRPGELIEHDFKGEKESDIQSQEAQGANKTDISASADATNVAVTPDATTSDEKVQFVTVTPSTLCSSSLLPRLPILMPWPGPQVMLVIPMFVQLCPTEMQSSPVPMSLLDTLILSLMLICIPSVFGLFPGAVMLMLENEMLPQR